MLLNNYIGFSIVWLRTALQLSQIQDVIGLYKGSCLACEEGPGLCALAMTVLSLFFIIITLPLSMLFVVKVVQEYERAVIFRLGRLLTGGARGPGVFFVIPCVDIYEKIDMRSQTFEIPPQEVKNFYFIQGVPKKNAR